MTAAALLVALALHAGRPPADGGAPDAGPRRAAAGEPQRQPPDGGARATSDEEVIEDLDVLEQLDLLENEELFDDGEGERPR